MIIDWTSLLKFLGHPPGDLVYHLAVGSALLVILIAALKRIKGVPRSTTHKHLLIGAILLFSLQAFLAVINLIIAPSGGMLSSAAFLAETLLQTLILVWLIWTFIEKDETFLVTGGGLFVSLALLLWAAVSLVLLTLQPAFLPIDNTWMLTIWDLAGAALSALGCVILWMKRPQGWRVGTAALLTLGLGYALMLTFPDAALIRPGTIRLMQTLCLPWTIILLPRLCKPNDRQTLGPDPSERADVTPLLVDELLKISQLENDQEKNEAVARALSLSLVADMCYLVKMNGPEESPPALLAGYDLIREMFLPTPPISLDDLPEIFKSWQGTRVYAPVYPPIETRDAAKLTEIINYHRIGYVLAYPLGSPDLQGGVIFLTPYTDKKLARQGEILMAGIESALTRVLFEPGLKAKLSAELDHVRAQAETARQEREALSGALTDSQIKAAGQEKQIRQLKARYQVEKLETVKELEACQEKIIRLSAQAASQKQSLEKLDEMKARIRTLVSERQQLERKLADANTRIEAFNAQLAQPPAPQSGLQPETSNKEALSSETLSTEALSIEALSLDALAANARMAYSPRCQRKGVILDITNPDGHQLIKTHSARLQALIHHLLENALLASKPEGSIYLRLKLSFETGMLHIQVTDSGEGLSPVDQRALFGEMEEPPAGIGSLPALQEAVRIVQALNGKIWLRSKPGAFTTLRIQLPVRILD